MTPEGPAWIVGASGGIGAALVSVLEAAGRPTARLSRRGGAYPALDLTDEASIKAALAAAEAAVGPPRLVIVATGLLHGPGVAPEKSLSALTPEAMTQAFAVNAAGPALVAKHALPRLPRSGKAVFAALSARVGSIEDNRLGGWHAYRASKAALNMLIKTMAIELARTRPEAICAALHPGTVDTGLSAPFQSRLKPGQLTTPEAAANRLLSVLAALAPKDSGGRFAWDGAPIPA